MKAGKQTKDIKLTSGIDASAIYCLFVKLSYKHGPTYEHVPETSHEHFYFRITYTNATKRNVDALKQVHNAETKIASNMHYDPASIAQFVNISRKHRTTLRVAVILRNL